MAAATALLLTTVGNGPSGFLPYSGYNTGFPSIAASPIYIQPNGSIATTNQVVTITDSTGLGSFNVGGTITTGTATMTFAFSGSTDAAQSFIYTPAANATGTITLTVSNTGTTVLTNPSPVSFTIATPSVLGVTSIAAKFSPGNWKGDSATAPAYRGGTVYRQTWNPGAWCSFTILASATPAVYLQLNNTSALNTVMLSIKINGALYDNISTNLVTNLLVQNVLPSQINTIEFILHNSGQVARWHTGSEYNYWQVTGLLVDSGTVAANAPSALPWGLVVGDSITEGQYAGASSTDSATCCYSYFLRKALPQYDVGLSACGFSGFLHTGDSSNDVPAYYVVSGGAYNESTSRWDKIDSGVSLLDSASQLSSYGLTGTPPSWIVVNYGTNDVIYGSGYAASDVRLSAKGAITALRAAAPNAIIFWIIPFGLRFTAVYSQYTNYAVNLAALLGGASDYQAANPTDKNFVIVDGQQEFANTINCSPYPTSNYVHPNGSGHGLAASQVVIPAIKTALMQRGLPVTYS